MSQMAPPKKAQLPSSLSSAATVPKKPEPLEKEAKSSSKSMVARPQKASGLLFTTFLPFAPRVLYSNYIST